MCNLIGSWEFVKSIANDTEGNLLYDPMNDAKGLLVYTDAQCISVQLYMPDKKIIAYYGYYKVDLNKSIVIHHIIAATYGLLVNRSVARKIKFNNSNYISLTNISLEQVDMKIPIYRELFWRRITNKEDGVSIEYA